MSQRKCFLIFCFAFFGLSSSHKILKFVRLCDRIEPATIRLDSRLSDEVYIELTNFHEIYGNSCGATKRLKRVSDRESWTIYEVHFNIFYDKNYIYRRVYNSSRFSDSDCARFETFLLERNAIFRILGLPFVTKNPTNSYLFKRLRNKSPKVYVLHGRSLRKPNNL